MSKPDKRYYKINISGEEHTFTNVEDIGDGKYIANAVDKNGKAAEYFSTLYLSEIENARISDKFPVPDRQYEYMSNDFIVSDIELEQAIELAFELDESFRHISEDYQKQYPDTLIPEIYNYEDAGRYFMDHQTLDGRTLNFLEDYINYEKFGRDYADDNNCFLLDDGMLLDSEGGATFHKEYDGNVLNIPEEMRITPIETEPAFIVEKENASVSLAEELDRFFRQHNREYSDTYSDISQTQKFISDCLINGELEFIHKWLYDLGQDEGDALPIEVKEYENKYLQDKIRESEETQMSEEKQEKITVLVVEPMAEPYTKEIDNTLESLQKEVGGLIQATYPYDDLIAIVCNDEGKINGLELNRAVYDDERNMLDIIAGTFLVVGLSEDSFATLPDDMMAKYKEMFKQPQTFIRLNNEIVAIPVKPSIRKQLNINKEQGGRDGQKAPEHKPPEL